MRDWTEKHIRELVRAWYSRGGSDIDLSDWNQIIIQIDTFETHLVAPLVNQRNVLCEGRIDKIEVINIDSTTGDSQAHYRNRILKITGDIPQTTFENDLILKVPIPIRWLPTAQSIIVDNGRITHGPFGTLIAPFTGRILTDIDTYNGGRANQRAYIADGVLYEDPNYDVKGENFSTGSTEGGMDNPFGLVEVDYGFIFSISNFNDFCSIKLEGTPACHELILFPRGMSSGENYSSAQSRLMDLPSRT